MLPTVGVTVCAIPRNAACMTISAAVGPARGLCVLLMLWLAVGCSSQAQKDREVFSLYVLSDAAVPVSRVQYVERGSVIQVYVEVETNSLESAFADCSYEAVPQGSYMHKYFTERFLNTFSVPNTPRPTLDTLREPTSTLWLFRSEAAGQRRFALAVGKSVYVWTVRF